jgi:hypothetical protein
MVVDEHDVSRACEFSVDVAIRPKTCDFKSNLSPSTLDCSTLVGRAEFAPAHIYVSYFYTLFRKNEAASCILSSDVLLIP